MINLLLMKKKELNIILRIKDSVAIHIATLKGGIYLATFLEKDEIIEN